MTLPVVLAWGTPYEQGLQHGRALKARIERNLAVYAECFAREGLPAAVVREQAWRFLDAVATGSAAYADALRGVAEGAGVPLDDVAALNARYEILYYQFGQNALADGCTAVALAPSVTANSHLLLGQNWDWLPEAQGAVLHAVDPDGWETLSFTEAGIVGGKIGLSSAGLGLTINGLSTTVDDWSRPAKPFHLRCYEILHARDLDTAARIVTEGDRACAANFLLAQVPDQIVDLEAAPGAVRALRPVGGCLVHANHLVDPLALGVVETPSERHDTSCHRQERLEQLLRSAGPISTADVERFLRDHDGYPYSVCYHVAVDAAPDERYATVASVVMDLTARTFAVADGPPCRNPYQRLALAPR